MGLSAVVAAVATRWASQSMDSTVSGGLHSEVAPKSTSAPFAILGDARTARTGFAARVSGSGSYGTDYNTTGFRITLVSNEGPTATATMAAAIRAALDHAPLSVSGATLLDARFEGEWMMPGEPERPGATLWIMEFSVRTAEAVNRSPS